MQGYDEAVVKCFLKNQTQLFPEPVADSYEEAEAFLEECADENEILEAEEVFDIGDGRYLIVE